MRLALFTPPGHRTAAPTRLRRSIVGAALMAGTLSLSIGALSVGTASAQNPELPVNALAPEINAEAELAVAAHDEYLGSGDLADFLDYAQHRTATARLAARQLGYEEFAMIDAWQSASLDHQRAVLEAMTQVGVPYRTNASAEGVAFDCSGLTLFAWAATGVELPRISTAQIRNADTVDRSEAQAGDLVHYPGHIMMYLGVGDAIVHSIRTGRTVELDTLSARRANRVTFGNPDA